MGSYSRAPPPYHSGSKDEETSFTVCTSSTLQPSTSASSHVAQIVTVKSSRGGRVWYSISIPKKREGWKAEVCSVSEKDRQELRYEVRREPLSRRFDFRDPEGNHNVMFPSSSLSQKSYVMEAPDGQKLMWKKGSDGWALLSMPSQTLIAQYTTIKGHHQQGIADQITLGRLEIMTLPIDNEPAILGRANTNVSTSSSSSSEGGPRLGRTFQGCSVGIGIPAAIVAAVASPFAAAGMGRNSILGDELANLGRGEIKPTSQRRNEAGNTVQVIDPSWQQRNRGDEVRRSDDPRPRSVELDLIVSSFVAVLAG